MPLGLMTHLLDSVLLPLVGVSLLLLAVAHLPLSRLLNWQGDMQKLTPINRKVFYAHTVFLVVGIFLLGLCCLFFHSALTTRSTLGAVAAACFAMCWISRLLFQIFFFQGQITGSASLDFFFKVGGFVAWFFYSLVFSLLFACQIGVIAD